MAKLTHRLLAAAGACASAAKAAWSGTACF
jgi:hypothetical protein